MPVDTIWTIIAFVLSVVIILSYLIGEKYSPFKVVSYLFIGVSAGYAAVVVIFHVLYPRLIAPLLFPDIGYSRTMAIIPLALSGLLLFKIFPKTSSLGNLATGIIVGSAAGVIIGGAILGTLFSQGKAAILLFDPGLGVETGRLVDALFMLLGTITTLLYFQFGGVKRPGKPVERTRFVGILANFGKFFIAVTMGALFAGVIAAAISALAERMSFLSQVINLWLR
jgi:hypothetical protein